MVNKKVEELLGLFASTFERERLALSVAETSQLACALVEYFKTRDPFWTMDGED